MTGWLCRQAASMVDGGQVNQVRRPAAYRYVAAVPELSAGLPPIPGLPWESLSHRQVLAELSGIPKVLFVTWREPGAGPGRGGGQHLIR